MRYEVINFILHTSHLIETVHLSVSYIFDQYGKKDIKQMMEGPGLLDRMKEHLYSGESVLGQGNPFSELLQQMMNQMLEGKMDAFLDEQKASGTPNKRNGRGFTPDHS